MKTKLFLSSLLLTIAGIMQLQATDYYFVGAAVGWNPTAAQFVEQEGVLTLEVADFYGDFKITEGAWHPQYGAAVGVTTDSIKLNEPYVLTKCDDSEGEKDIENVHTALPENYRYKDAKFTLTVGEGGVLTLTLVAGTPYDHVVPAAYQIVGAYNNWSTADAIQFEEVGGVLTATVPDLNGTFKIIQDRAFTNQWATNWETGAGLELGVAYTLGAKGDAEPSNLFLANPFGGYKNAVLTLQVGEQMVLTLVSGEFYATKNNWYFPGTKLGWNCDETTQFTPVEGKENTYEFHAAEFGGDFKVVYGNWNVEFGANVVGDTWEINKEYVMACPCAGNLNPLNYADVYTDVTITITVDYENAQVKLLLTTKGAYIYYFNTDNYKFAIYNQDDNSDGEWSDWMTPVSGHPGWYKTTIPEENQHLTFASFPTSQSSPNADDIIYKTSKLTYDESNAYYVEGQGWQSGYNIEDILSSGFHGDLKWILDYKEVLTIFGIGDMNDFSSIDDYTSWRRLKDHIKSVIIKDGVTNIGAYAFADCTYLTSISIPNSVTSIRSYSFHGCSDLTSITIPSSVTNILRAFYGCSRLTSVTMEASTPALLSNGAFDNCSNVSIYVPCGSLEIYKTTDVWSDYASSIKYLPLEFNIKVLAENGDITYPQTICDKMLLVANPAYGYHFTQWSDGNTDNPRTFVLTQDTTFMAEFAQNHTISYIYNSEMGKVSGPMTTDAGVTADSISFQASANYGYHFVQWSDGIKDNPRTIWLSQDTTFTAEFALDRRGTCGNDYTLMWEYDPDKNVLTISGNGELTENYTYGLEAPTQMKDLIISNDVRSIGDSAFYKMSTINHLTIGYNVEYIGDYAFAECKNFDDITCYATTVPTITDKTFANIGNKQYIYLFVAQGRERAYLRDIYWGEFDVQVKNAGTITEPIEDVQVTPTENTADIVWPSITGTVSYELVIKDKQGNIICTLTFNSQGQLVELKFHTFTSNGKGMTDEAQPTGFSFTITGLDQGTTYDYTITSKDDDGTILDTKTGSFTTHDDVTTNNEDVIDTQHLTQPTKVLVDGAVYIIMPNGRRYNLQGAEVK